MTERLYAMTKLDRGDYLCPSNDASWIWRFRTYEYEDADGNGNGKTVVQWRADCLPIAEFERFVDSPDGTPDDFDALPWEFVELVPSRKDAIEVMTGRTDA